jgi:hypothetical protein
MFSAIVKARKRSNAAAANAAKVPDAAKAGPGTVAPGVAAAAETATVPAPSCGCNGACR